MPSKSKRTKKPKLDPKETRRQKVLNAVGFDRSHNKVQVREALLLAGFDRKGSSHDCGDGHYEEFWSNGVDEIVLRWKYENYKRISLNEHSQVATAGLCEKCGKKTRWIVSILGRTTYWCGCE